MPPRKPRPEPAATFTLDLKDPVGSFIAKTGYYQSEVAERLGVTKGAISQRARTEGGDPKRRLTVAGLLEMLDKFDYEVEVVLVRKKST